MLTRDLVRTTEASDGTPFRGYFEPVQSPEILSDQRCTEHTIGVRSKAGAFLSHEVARSMSRRPSFER